MSTAQTVLLGAIAGFTIYLGLPVGRVRTQRLRAKAFLNAASAGILVFLLFDILAHATEPVEDAMTTAKAGEGPWGRFAGLGLVYIAGFGVGLLALFYLARAWPRRGRPAGTSIGPGAMAAAEATRPPAEAAALRVGMSIAAGIGLHNFSEGLAIGQAAHSGEISLATPPISPASPSRPARRPRPAAGVRASWGWLGLAGLIGGGPTFLGTIVGTSFDSAFVYVGCLALAAGAILYVIGEILPVGRRLSWEITLWGLAAGFLLGVATDLVVEASGG